MKKINIRRSALSVVVMICCISDLGISGCGNAEMERVVSEAEVVEATESTEVTKVFETEKVGENEIIVEDITEEYTQLLNVYTEESLVDILVDDFEKNGEYSAFAVTCENYSAERAEFEDYDGLVYPANLWFLKGDTCILLEENIQYMDFSLENTEFTNGIKPIMFNTWLSNSSHMSTIYLVEAGEPMQLGNLEYAEWYNNDTILESKLVRTLSEDGSTPIMGEDKSVYKIESGELVLVDSWSQED